MFELEHSVAKLMRGRCCSPAHKPSKVEQFNILSHNRMPFATLGVQYVDCDVVVGDA